MSDGPIDRLVREYADWNAAQGLALGSADEHLFDETLTDTQRAWLHSFCARWDAAEDTERAWADAEKEAFEGGDKCPGTSDGMHSFVTADKDNGGDGRSYCEWCGADGDA